MMAQPPKPEDIQKSYETITPIDGTIEAEPVDSPWYCGLIFERIGPHRENLDHWVAHLTLGNSTIHMPMKVFITLKKILSEIKQ
jgi:hypothetical protein